MSSSDLIDLGLDGLRAQVEALVRDLDRMSDAVEAGAIDAAVESAQMIATEQKRLLSAANFKHKTADLASLIKVKQSKGKRYFRLNIGYDTEAIKAHPEVLVIEYGRPGKSARRMSKKDSLGRKKGDFPPQTPHIKPGFILAKDKAAEHFRDSLLEIAKQKWNNGG